MKAGLADVVRLQNDGSLTGVGFARPQGHYSDSESELRSQIEVFGPRRPLPRAALQLQDPHLKCDRNLDWNIDWAVAHIVDYLETKSTDIAEALRDIRIRAALLERQGSIEDIPYRIFNKLADVLFAGHLRNAIFLEVRNLNSDVSGATFTHGWGPNSNVKRISIVLNNKALQCSNAREIVAILIHHMIHAYFLVACGPQKEDEVAYGRLDHGLHFAKVMFVIKKLSAAHGKPLTPLNFGHDSFGLQFANEIYHPGSAKFVERENEDKKKWYCSHCHYYVELIPENAVDKWYNKSCKVLFDLPSILRKGEVAFYNDCRFELDTRARGRLLPSDKSVEFLFRGKGILVDSKKVGSFLGVKRAFEKANSRFVEIHKSVSDKTFLRFLEFLYTGKYRPDLSSYIAATAGLGMGRRGPPIIRPPGPTSEAPLLAEIQFCKLGNQMGFDECKGYALSRMNVYGVLSEDPVAVLKEIYDGREPDADLKSWARKFLVQAPAPAFGEPSTINSTMEPPNLIKLENEQGSYRVRFLDAVDSNGSLENDVNKARAALKAAGWYNWTTTGLLSFASKFQAGPVPLPLGIVQSPPLMLNEQPSPAWLPNIISPVIQPPIATGLTGLTGLPSPLTTSTQLAVQEQRAHDAAKIVARERKLQLEMENLRLQRLEKGEEEARLRAEYEENRRWELERAEVRMKEDRERRERARREREQREYEQLRAAEALKRFYDRNLGGFVQENGW